MEKPLVKKNIVAFPESMSGNVGVDAIAISDLKKRT